MMWLNEEKMVLSAGEQLEPVLDENGKFIYGHQLPNGEFQRDKEGATQGPDILHRVVPGQIRVADDDPRVIAFRNRKVKTADQQVEDQMNSPAVLAVRAIMNADAAADSRIRKALKDKLEAEQGATKAAHK